MNCTSCKLEAPVKFVSSDLDLTRFMSGPLRRGESEAWYEDYTNNV